MVYKLRPKRREFLNNPVKQGKTDSGQHGTGQKLPSQHPDAQQVTTAVERHRRPGRGNPQPVFRQEQRAQGAAFGDVADLVNMVKAKGQNEASQQGKKKDGFSAHSSGTRVKEKVYVV